MGEGGNDLSSAVGNKQRGLLRLGYVQLKMLAVDSTQFILISDKPAGPAENCTQSIFIRVTLYQ